MYDAIKCAGDVDKVMHGGAVVWDSKPAKIAFDPNIVVGGDNGRIEYIVDAGLLGSVTHQDPGWFVIRCNRPLYYTFYTVVIDGKTVQKGPTLDYSVHAASPASFSHVMAVVACGVSTTYKIAQDLGVSIEFIYD